MSKQDQEIETPEVDPAVIQQIADSMPDYQKPKMVFTLMKLDPETDALAEEFMEKHKIAGSEFVWPQAELAVAALSDSSYSALDGAYWPDVSDENREELVRRLDFN